MKNIPAPLLEYLLSIDVQSTFTSDLFTITLKSGQIFYATDGQMPVTYLGNVYEPSKFGSWKITKIHTALGMTQSTAEFEVIGGIDTIIDPFEIPLMEVIQLGLMDAAKFTIVRWFSLTYGDTSLGVEIKYEGQITELTKTGRTIATGTAEAYTFALNQQMPRQTLQPGCRWTLYDPDTCTVNKASFTYSNAAGPGGNNVVIAPATPITTPTGISLAQGTVTFTSGRNTGLSMSIQSVDGGGNLRLSRPFLFPVAVGDTFNASAGCAHTFSNCLAFLPSTAYINFGGTPFIPNQEASI